MNEFERSVVLRKPVNSLFIIALALLVLLSFSKGVWAKDTQNNSDPSRAEKAIQGQSTPLRSSPATAMPIVSIPEFDVVESTSFFPITMPDPGPRSRALVSSLLLAQTLPTKPRRHLLPATPTPTPTIGEIAYNYDPGTSGAISSTYTINLDGSENKPVPNAVRAHNHHDWSPDGTRMAVQGYNPHSIYVFNIDGTNWIRLTTTPGVTDTEPAWSPDSSQIVFTRFPSTEVNLIEQADLRIMNADGSNNRSTGINGGFANWSPDGHRLVYIAKVSNNTEIFTCQVDGTQVQRLTNSTREKFAPIYSHDGRKIAFCAQPTNGGFFEIFVMNVDGTGVEQLTHNTSQDFNPRWSADDSLILFQSNRIAPNHDEVYVMNADGSNIRRVTTTVAPASIMMPVWRPGR